LFIFVSASIAFVIMYDWTMLVFYFGLLRSWSVYAMSLGRLTVYHVLLFLYITVIIWIEISLVALEHSL